MALSSQLFPTPSPLPLDPATPSHPLPIPHHAALSYKWVYLKDDATSGSTAFYPAKVIPITSDGEWMDAVDPLTAEGLYPVAYKVCTLYIMGAGQASFGALQTAACLPGLRPACCVGVAAAAGVLPRRQHGRRPSARLPLPSLRPPAPAAQVRLGQEACGPSRNEPCYEGTYRVGVVGGANLESLG